MRPRISCWKKNYRLWPILNRPPENFRPTDCYTGYSMWHLCALGLVEDHTIPDFLVSVMNQSSGVIIDDLRECTWKPLPVHLRGWVGELHGIELGEFNRYFLYRSVADLCLMTNIRLFGYWPVHKNTLHPVVTAFNASLRLEGNSHFSPKN